MAKQSRYAQKRDVGTHVAAFDVPADLWKAFVAKCKTDDRSAAATLRKLVREYVNGD